MFSAGMNMSPKDMMGARPDRSSDYKSNSSGSKRKHEGHNFETVEVIRDTMDCVEDR